MRTTVKIVGIGERKAGVSTKNGKPYDFLPISFVYPDKFTKGLRAATANVSGEMVDAVGGVKLDDQRDIFYHTYNNAVVIDGIL